jgi:hypothetical protein
VAEAQWQRRQAPLTVQEVRHREGHVLHALHLCQWRADGKQATVVVSHDFDQVRQCTADAIVRGAFALDDLVRRIPYLVVDPLADLFAKRNVEQASVFLQRQPSHVDDRPGQDFRIAVFTDHIAVYVLRFVR